MSKNSKKRNKLKPNNRKSSKCSRSKNDVRPKPSNNSKESKSKNPNEAKSDFCPKDPMQSMPSPSQQEMLDYLDCNMDHEIPVPLDLVTADPEIRASLNLGPTDPDVLAKLLEKENKKYADINSENCTENELLGSKPLDQEKKREVKAKQKKSIVKDSHSQVNAADSNPRSPSGFGSIYNSEMQRLARDDLRKPTLLPNDAGNPIVIEDSENSVEAQVEETKI